MPKPRFIGWTMYRLQIEVVQIGVSEIMISTEYCNPVVLSRGLCLSC